MKLLNQVAQQKPSRGLLCSVVLFFEYFFAPGAFAALGAFQVTGGAGVHRVQCLRIGGHKFVPAVFAFIGAHADLQL